MHIYANQMLEKSFIKLVIKHTIYSNLSKIIENNSKYSHFEYNKSQLEMNLNSLQSSHKTKVYTIFTLRRNSSSKTAVKVIPETWGCIIFPLYRCISTWQKIILHLTQAKCHYQSKDPDKRNCSAIHFRNFRDCFMNSHGTDRKQLV